MSGELRNSVVDAAAAGQLLEDIEGRLDGSDSVLRMLADDLIDYETEVFVTSGFGTWAPLDPYTVRSKGSGRILVDTGGLLDSLTSRGSIEISGDTVTVITDDTAAPYLQRGARGMPKRDPAPEPPAQVAEQWAVDALGFLIDGRRR